MLCSILQFLLSDIRKVSFFCSFFLEHKKATIRTKKREKDEKSVEK